MTAFLDDSYAKCISICFHSYNQTYKANTRAHAQYYRTVTISSRRIGRRLDCCALFTMTKFTDDLEFKTVAVTFSNAGRLEVYLLYSFKESTCSYRLHLNALSAFYKCCYDYDNDPTKSQYANYRFIASSKHLYIFCLFVWSYILRSQKNIHITPHSLQVYLYYSVYTYKPRQK